jgi:hypothetical protein
MDMHKILEILNESKDTMKAAEKHPRGAKFGGYWKGTDKSTPKPGQGVGGSCEESIEEEIARDWQNYLMEFGANNPAQTAGPGTNPVNQQATAKQLQTTQQNFNKIKSAGVDVPTGVANASQSTVKNVNDPKVNPATGQGLDSNSKKVLGGLGAEMENLLATGNPGQVQQVANVIKQAKLSGKK